MTMKNSEIVRSFNEAKKKKEQIQILAELNCCSKDDIIKILYEGGAKIDGRLFNGGDMKKKEEAAVIPAEEPTQEVIYRRIPETVIRFTEDRLTAICGRLAAISEEADRLMAEQKELLEFLEG